MTPFKSPLKALVAAASILAPLSAATAAAQAASIVRPNTRTITLDVSKGTLIRLDRPASNVFIADPKVADVQVKSPQLIYVFGVGDGETSLYAVDSDDRILYSATVAVAQNLGQLKTLISAIAPDETISVSILNGMVVLSGVVERPEVSEEISRLAQDFVGENQKIVNRIKVTTPTQVSLQVKIAEISRDVLKQLGSNWETLLSVGDNGALGFTTGSDLFEIEETIFDLLDPATGAPLISAGGLPLQQVFERQIFTRPSSGSSISGGFTGDNLRLGAVIEALETEGFVNILAEPTLIALTGETATFLAGGEFPIPVPDDNRIVIEYKEFGVGLSFTPTVMANDRISMRVRPEVSQLSTEAAIQVNGIAVPGLTTRRAETTVELGSGQGFAIAGLLQQTLSQTAEKLPGLGDLPVLGALFRSDRFRNQETELVIIVTPYLVKPTDPRNLRTPRDGLRPPSDMARYFRGETFATQPMAAPEQTVANGAPMMVGPAGFSIGN
ncbi:MAG: type II and III secretion system protein family protein [Pseudomonadota bacterium]